MGDVIMLAIFIGGMAYVSDASGRAEVYVRPHPGADARTQVSTNRGMSPVWAHNGSELFYIDGDGWMTVAIYGADPTFTVSDRQRLFQAQGAYFGAGTYWRVFDVASDDERFLMIAFGGGGL
jgi:hypothetical protein